jgi:hypothetical protein
MDLWNWTCIIWTWSWTWSCDVIWTYSLWTWIILDLWCGDLYIVCAIVDAIGFIYIYIYIYWHCTSGWPSSEAAAPRYVPGIQSIFLWLWSATAFFYNLAVVCGCILDTYMWTCRCVYIYIYATVVVKFHINIFIYLFSKMHCRGSWNHWKSYVWCW